MDPICLSVPKVTVFICIGDVTEIRIVLMVLMRRIAVSYYRSRKGFFFFFSNKRYLGITVMEIFIWGGISSVLQ